MLIKCLHKFFNESSFQHFLLPVLTLLDVIWRCRNSVKFQDADVNLQGMMRTVQSRLIVYPGVLSTPTGHPLVVEPGCRMFSYSSSSLQDTLTTSRLCCFADATGFHISSCGMWQLLLGLVLCSTLLAFPQL